MTLVANIRAKLLNSEINQRSLFYQTTTGKEERLKWQLEQFNANWVNIIQNVPHYHSLYQKGEIPEKFETWNQFRTELPISERKQYILEKSLRTNHSQKPDYVRITGGSSGNPLQIPAWNSEKKFTKPDQWVGRHWFGINPEDHCFWLMGNSQLLGRGFKGIINKYKRAVKDKLLGYYRCPAYNLQPEIMKHLADILIRKNPDYVIGFSGVLDIFARINIDLKEEFKKLRIKAIIATSEIFPFEDSPKIIAETFQAPVAMEYGSNETIAIAHTNPSGIFKVFWKNYFVEGLDSETSNMKNILITSLYPRCFPLIRYDLGDQIELDNCDETSTFGIEEFKKVHGRKNNFVTMKDGSRIHTAAFSHSIRIFDELTGYQIIDNGIELNLNITTLTGNLSHNLINEIKYRLSQIHPELSAVQINNVTHLEQMKNGKTPLLIRI